MGFDETFDKVFGSFGAGLGISVAISIIMFLLVFGIITAVIVMMIKTWKKNNDSPALTVMATIVSKRTRISHSHYGHIPNHANGATSLNGSVYYDSFNSSTFYYATFQVESGDRMEFCIPCEEFGLLVEGDRGRLTFKGTRYVSFVRI